MESVIISDTSCLIVLDKIGHLSLLQEMYGQIIVTSIVASEFGKELPDWCRIVTPTNTSLKKALEESIDPGEAESIALAVETADSLLILDDLRARKIAASLGLAFTGTLGVVAGAKKRGIIPAARPIFELLRSTDFRLSKTFLEAILVELGE
jgi:predicted nucleic acid-binding protein